MKNKKNLGTIVAISIFVIVVICSMLITEKLAPKDDYADVEFADITVEEFKEVFNEEEEKFIYIGRPTCPYCVESEPWSKRISKDMDKEIYYINTDEQTNNALVELAEITDGVYSGATPLFLIVENGEIIDYLEGAGSYENLKSFFTNNNE